MKILRTNIPDIENNKKAFYKLTKSAGTNASELDGKTADVKYYALYSDVDSTGKDREVLSVVLANGEKIQAISQTFIREFFNIVDLMGEDTFNLIIVHGQSNNGNDFVTCELDCD